MSLAKMEKTPRSVEPVDEPSAEGSDSPKPPLGLVRLNDLTLVNLERLCRSLGDKAYRGRQLADWLHVKNVFNFDEMSNIPGEIRLHLKRKTDPRPLVRPLAVETADDSSRRIVWELRDGARVESVVIPRERHLTLCLSTQVGCRMGCRFCRTGTLGFKRNLTSGEILGQIQMAKRVAADRDNRLVNLVFMGMGEPLDNLEALRKSFEIIFNHKLMSFSPRHVTVSTVGVIPAIDDLTDDLSLKLGLTISLGSADENLRRELMPCDRSWPLARLKEALQNHRRRGGRRVTLAMVLLDGVNDGVEQAEALSRFMADLKAKINLIPFNPWPGASFAAPSEEKVLAFQRTLLDKFHTALIRRSAGGSVGAACGQLIGKLPAPADKDVLFGDQPLDQRM